MIEVVFNSNQVRSKEGGFISTMGIVAALPIMLLLFMAVSSFTRVPVAKDRVIESLMTASFGVEKNLILGSSPKLYDPYTPAAHAIGELATGTTYGPPSALDGSGRSGFLVNAVISSIQQEACNLAKTSMTTNSSGLFNYGAGDNVAIQFGMVKVTINAATGAVSDIVPANSAGGGDKYDCYQGSEDFAAISAGVGVNVASLRNAMKTKFLGQNLAWNVASRTDLWLESYWLIGVAYVRVKHTFPGFFGADSMVMEYFIRPMNVPAGIQNEST